eukprot:2499709-Amphidinium_carterae.1
MMSYETARPSLAQTREPVTPATVCRSERQRLPQSRYAWLRHRNILKAGGPEKPTGITVLNGLGLDRRPIGVPHEMRPSCTKLLTLDISLWASRVKLT